MDTDNRFGARLRTARKARGLTQLQVADAIGVHRRVVSHYEQGRCIPRSHRITALAEVLGIKPLDVLVMLEGELAASA